MAVPKVPQPSTRQHAVGRLCVPATCDSSASLRTAGNAHQETHTDTQSKFRRFACVCVDIVYVFRGSSLRMYLAVAKALAG